MPPITAAIPISSWPGRGPGRLRPGGVSAAFELLVVGSVAVGTDRPDHLRELVDATGLAVDYDLVGWYGELFVERAAQAR
ncbi:hypothetical protein GCM10009759_64910 [Kitasatospora saccharophila]|uniref:Uncharacterized protein n=1 Tax=Kitasatospora saccharophila TaxID=407973 RepID=A0ABN2XWB0_9ACTN